MERCITVVYLSSVQQAFTEIFECCGQSFTPTFVRLRFWMKADSPPPHMQATLVSGCGKNKSVEAADENIEGLVGASKALSMATKENVAGEDLEEAAGTEAGPGSEAIAGFPVHGAGVDLVGE